MKIAAYLLPIVLAGILNPINVLAETASNKKETPLTGKAWKFADDGYKKFDLGKYAEAEKSARRAIALRPDSLSLRLLLIYALEKQNKLEQAKKEIVEAKKFGFSNKNFEEIEKNLQLTAEESKKSPAYRKAFPYAEIGYAAYLEQEYEKSAINAEKAFRMDPEQGDWALLWINALEAQKKYQEAIDASETAIALGAKNTSDLNGRKLSMQRLLSMPFAERAFQSTDPSDAVINAQKAVEIAPDVGSHRLLLVTSLIRLGKFEEAEMAATSAIELNSEDTNIIVLRGYLRHFLGNHDQARSDFITALKHDWLDEEQLKDIRLIAADGSIISGDVENAKYFLNDLDNSDIQVSKRIDAILNYKKNSVSEINASNYPPPYQECRDTHYGTVCSVKPADSLLNTPTGLAYDAYSKGEFQKAIEYAQRALDEDPTDIQRNRLLTTSLAAGNENQKNIALSRLSNDINSHPNDANLLLQRAYLYISIDEPNLALQDIRAARSFENHPDNAIVAEGFAQSASGDRLGAIETLKKSIDLSENGDIKLSDSEIINTKNAITHLDRNFGITFGVGYRGGRAASTSGSAPIIVPGKSIFSSAEVYWRPFDSLNSNKSNFEVYGRLTNTLHSGASKLPQQTVTDPCSADPIAVDSTQYSGTAGFPTTVGALGARFTPSTDLGVTFGLERHFLIGSAARQGGISPANSMMRCRNNALPLSPINQIQYEVDRSDGGWLAYAAWGYYYGTERKLDVPSWWTMDSYIQAGWAWKKMDAKLWINGSTQSRTGTVSRDQGFASAEMRVGRSFRMDEISEKLVLFPHLVFGIDWQKNKDKVSFRDGINFYETTSISDYNNWAGSVGVGVGARFWFREGKYHAPRSYVDWSLQYRTNIGGQDSRRAKGVYMNLSFSY